MLGKNAKIELLRRVPLFAACSKRELAEIASVADELHMSGPRALTLEGAKGRDFVILVEGEADVVRKGRTVGTLGPGDFLGEIALVTGRARTATVRTRGEARLLVLEATAFRRLLRDVPSLQTRVLEALAARIPPDYD
jgi:CRP/FNR family transcriptional regulator, cyclic AMP receptor protein